MYFSIPEQYITVQCSLLWLHQCSHVSQCGALADTNNKVQVVILDFLMFSWTCTIKMKAEKKRKEFLKYYLHVHDLSSHPKSAVLNYAKISDSMFFSILSLLTVFPDLHKNHCTLQPGKFHMSQVKAWLCNKTTDSALSSEKHQVWPCQRYCLPGWMKTPIFFAYSKIRICFSHCQNTQNIHDAIIGLKTVLNPYYLCMTPKESDAYREWETCTLGLICC